MSKRLNVAYPPSRAGTYAAQPGGWRAFIPAPLPPKPALRHDASLAKLVGEADRALGRLDGATSVLPNPELFVAMYVRREAVLSSQIEGTQSTLEDVLEFEIDAHRVTRPRDVEEVVNYIHAMNYGLERLRDRPLTLNLIREIHERLMSGVRGGNRDPGRFRRIQNYVGPDGCTLATALFVPPPVPAMTAALHDLEVFIHDRTLPLLVHCALVHAQFETIHPFLDGNGRVGRLLITFILCERGALARPLLYLSHYLRANRAEYYDRLTAIRERGDWEGWVAFFLRGVEQVADEATRTAQGILAMREEHRDRIARRLPSSANGQVLLDHLFGQPITTVRLVEERLGSSYATANSLVQTFVEQGLLREMTGGRRNRRFSYDPYLALFQTREPNAPEGDRPIQATATVLE